MPLTSIVEGNIFQVMGGQDLNLGFCTAEDPAFPYQEDSLTIKWWVPQGNLCPAEAVPFHVIFPDTLKGKAQAQALTPDQAK